MNHNTAHRQKPNHNHDRFPKALGIFADNAVDGDGLEKFERDVDVEDGGDADGAEETDENGLALLFDLGDEFVDGEDDWKTSGVVSLI